MTTPQLPPARAARQHESSRYQVPRLVSESILASPDFRAALQRIADELGRPLDAMLAESRRTLREIVSRPSPLFLDLRALFYRRVFMRGYEPRVRVNVDEIETLRRTLAIHPTVLLFTHKSYTDAALPQLVLYEHDLPMLHTFGGINLDIAGFGTLMRRSGGIFIRRAFKDDSVYKLVLQRYVGFLLENGFPMAWALEGTRSRLGKLMPPRYGLLKYVLDAAHAAGINDLHIVPFVSSFEQIRDVEEYAAEQAGRPKRTETLRWLWHHCTRKSRPMGRVRVDLGDAIVVREPPGPEDRMALVRLGLEVSARANRVTPLTVTAVMCLALLGTAPRGITAVELVKLVGVLAAWARARGIRMSEELENSDQAAFFAKLDALVASDLLLRNDEGSSVVYAIEPSRHAIASYYRNSIIHHFLNKAIIELALFKVGEDATGDLEGAFWRETERLRELFKFEFFYPPRGQFRGELIDEMARADPRWRMRLREDPGEVRHLARRFQPFIAHAALLPYVEAYTIVVGVLARLPPGEQLEAEACVMLALQEARQALLLRRISSEASIGKILFENGFALVSHMGLATAGDEEIIARRQALLQELQALSRRMERMRLEAISNAEQIMQKDRGPI
jgi:glycerol-3-phosphate O-acyltransferase